MVRPTRSAASTSSRATAIGLDGGGSRVMLGQPVSGLRDSAASSGGCAVMWLPGAVWRCRLPLMARVAPFGLREDRRGGCGAWTRRSSCCLGLGGGGPGLLCCCRACVGCQVFEGYAEGGGDPVAHVG